MKNEMKNETGTSINNCTFTGVVWDGQAIEAVNSVALALLNLTELFKAQNIEIESLLKIESNSNDAPDGDSDENEGE